MRIKELREQEGLKQAELAALLNVRQNTYSQYETGKREISIDILISLAKIFNVSADYILELTDVDEPYPRHN